MANWYDEPIKKVKVKETVETELGKSNFYDALRVIKDKEIKERLDYYYELGEHETRFIPYWYVPRAGDYDKHDFVNNLPYANTRKERALHKQRLAELDSEWEQELERIENDSSTRLFFIKGKGDNQKVMYAKEHNLFGILDISKTKKEFINSTYEIKVDGSNATYTGENRKEYNYHHPDYLLETRGVFQGTRFGYSERESIFNEPSVTFNKKGEPMATAKASDAINDILSKHGAAVSKTVNKKTTNKAPDKKKKLRDKWINHIVKMKSDFDVSGVDGAKGITYVKNATKLDESYFEVVFTLQRQQLGLSKGKGTFVVSSIESVSAFLQDMIDAISVETFDAQILSHQRKVDKARKEAKEKKENSK